MKPSRFKLVSAWRIRCCLAQISLLAAVLICCGSVRTLFAQASKDDKLLASYETNVPKFTDYKKDIAAYTVHAKQTDDPEQRANAVMDLCLLYFAVRNDRRYPTSEVLQGYANRLNYRLNETKKQLAREDRQKVKQANISNESASLAESALIPDEFSQLASVALVDQGDFMLLLHGGPQVALNRMGGMFGGVVMEANAQDLIELIQAIIHPDSWEVNGGSGRIQYWRQSMVLVVRATTQIHEDLEVFLNMLRRAF
ncbi:MAG TPA: hypothetical protein PKD64_02185 [Pirellulaceae bacterium]|nr:hypothetical protein [Pirellulaceae bacterium]HMO90978.1 hypothetical protein [Pirellulaceae bacterium]HMP68093.1 hypothetical protein [Pirellulaceae bacterium]